MRHQLQGGERRDDREEPETGKHPQNKGGIRMPGRKGCGINGKSRTLSDAAWKKPGLEQEVTDRTI